ncbi:MAG: DMT family transporter [Calditrichaeota bacterium]|nr:DMT family transporter [Calditrichota bacterium]MCB9391592.1 DMT family transporter [Calditrichota bacterium]
MTSLPHLGELLALTTAMLWAVAVILFKKSGETVHPVALNLFKSTVSGMLILSTYLLIEGTPTVEMPRWDLLLLFASGAIGIGAADTLFFMMLNWLGAALTSIVDCLYSPTVILASVIWLGESLSLIQLFGVLLIVSAVLEAVWVPRKKAPDDAEKAKGNLVGVLWGVTAMLCMGISIVIMKPLLDKYSLLWVIEMRQIGGVAAILITLGLMRNRREILKSLLIRRGWGWTLGGTFIGQYLALMAWVAGIKYTQASQASAINQTSNIFVFVLAGLLLKERLTKKRIIGIVLAVIGVYLVTFG